MGSKKRLFEFTDERAGRSQRRIYRATLYGVVYYEFGGALKRLSTTIDVVLGVTGTVVLVAFLVWTKRKEDELEKRAEREVGGSVAEQLGEEEVTD